MKTRQTHGAFIALIWALMRKVEEVTTGSVCTHPRPDMAADLLLQPVVSRGLQRRLAEDAGLTHRVYRFSSVDNETATCWNGGALKTSMWRAK